MGAGWTSRHARVNAPLGARFLPAAGILNCGPVPIKNEMAAIVPGTRVGACMTAGGRESRNAIEIASCTIELGTRFFILRFIRYCAAGPLVLGAGFNLVAALLDEPLRQKV